MSAWRAAAAARFGPAVAVHATPGVVAALAAAAGLTPAELLRPAGVRVDLNGEGGGQERGTRGGKEAVFRLDGAMRTDPPLPPFPTQSPSAPWATPPTACAT